MRTISLLSALVFYLSVIGHSFKVVIVVIVIVNVVIVIVNVVVIVLVFIVTFPPRLVRTILMLRCTHPRLGFSVFFPPYQLGCIVMRPEKRE